MSGRLTPAASDAELTGAETHRRAIGDYELGEVIGTGTVGTVYRARHRVSGDAVAVKVLAGSAARNEAVKKRFLREISILQRLHDPGVVAHSFGGVEDGVLYYVMELITSGTLEDLLRSRSRLTWRETAEIGARIATALEAVHSHGIVHRDLKPPNVFRTRSGEIKLGDFGLARDAASTKLTLVGHAVGTALYMAPEQISGRDAIDGRLDLYALGCVLFQCLTGRVPFEGEHVFTVLQKHLSDTPPRVDALATDCPASLAEVIDRLLAKEPAERPPSGASVARVLSRILADPDLAVVRRDFEAGGNPTVLVGWELRVDAAEPASRETSAGIRLPTWSQRAMAAGWKLLPFLRRE